MSLPNLTVSIKRINKKELLFPFIHQFVYACARIKKREKDPLAGKPIQFNKIVPPPHYAPKACESRKN